MEGNRSAIGYHPDLDAAGFYREKLLDHRFVCLLRARSSVQDHQLSLRASLSLEGTPRSLQRGRNQEIFEKYLERLRIQRRIVLHPHFMSLPGIIGRSDLVVTLPHAIGHYFTRMGERCGWPSRRWRSRISSFTSTGTGASTTTRNRWLRTLVAGLVLGRSRTSGPILSRRRGSGASRRHPAEAEVSQMFQPARIAQRHDVGISKRDVRGRPRAAARRA